MSISASAPATRATCMSPACPAAQSSSAVLPTPASPRSTSTPLSPSRTAASTPPNAPVSTARPSNALIALPSSALGRNGRSFPGPDDHARGRRMAIIPQVSPGISGGSRPLRGAVEPGAGGASWRRPCGEKTVWIEEGTVSLGDSLGIPTEAILAGERDSGAIGQETPYHERFRVSPSEDPMAIHACRYQAAGGRHRATGQAGPDQHHTPGPRTHPGSRREAQRRHKRCAPRSSARYRDKRQN